MAELATENERLHQQLSERMAVEDSLRESEHRYRLLFKDNPMPMWVYDSDTLRFLAVNHAAVKHYGYSRAEFLQMTISDIRPLEDIPALMNSMPTDEVRIDWPGSWKHQKKDGTVIDVEITSDAIEFSGKPARIVLAADVTERKRGEDARRQSERRYESLVNSIDGIVWEADPKTFAFTFVSRQAERLLGHPIAEWLEEPTFWADHIHPKDRDWAVDFCLKATAKGDDHQFEYRMIAADGRVVWLKDHVTVSVADDGSMRLRGVMLDITERKRAEEELKETKEWLTSVYDSSRDGIIVEESERIVFVNRSYANLFGYDPDELIGQSVRLVSEQGPDDRMTEYSRRRMRGEEAPSLYEFRATRKDGSTVDLEASVSTAQLGDKTCIIALCRDTTERKRAATEIQLQQARFQQLFENAPMGILMVDDRDVVINANKEFESIFQYSLSEIQKRSLKDTIVPEMYLTEGYDLSARTLQGEIVERETVRQRKDGTLVPVHIYGIPIVADEELVGVFGIYIDVTERKREEDERHIISDVIQGSITTSDLDDFLKLVHESIGKYLYAENCFIALYDETTELMHFPFWVDKFDPCPPPRAAGVGFSGYVLRTGKPMLVGPKLTEEMYRSGEIQKSGSPSASWLGVPLRTADRTVGVLVVQHYQEENVYDERDLEFLTSVGSQIALAIERKKTEEALCESEQMLRQAQKMESIGTLAGGIAHDFNNLMTAVTGYSQLVLRKLAVDDPLRSKIEEIKKAGERAAALTGQLLAFSRKQILKSEVINLNTVISDIGQMLPRLIGEDIELRFDLAPSLNQVKADPGQVEQILLNLAVNARDAMPRGGWITIKTENADLSGKFVKRRLVVEPGHYVLLSVSDNGCGMDAETQEHIFEPFFTTKEVGKGTGLGLSTVYGIVKQSGGSIWVYSEPGRGTTFKIYLPKCDDSAETDEVAEESSHAPGGHETILLVEDEDVVRDLCKEVLEAYGYKVVLASNGIDGLRACQDFSGQMDLLITDVVMPQMSGRELAEHVSALRPEIEVLYMSGFTDDDIVRHGVLDDGVCFIQKPFSPNSLALKAREVLDHNGKR